MKSYLKNPYVQYIIYCTLVGFGAYYTADYISNKYMRSLDVEKREVRFEYEVNQLAFKYIQKK